MIRLTTSVDIPSFPFSIKTSTPILMLGSCFSDNIGSLFKQGGLNVLSNPFGTLYNPLSISDALSRILTNTSISDTDIVFHDNLYHSWCHHGSFSSPDKNQTLSMCNSSISTAHNFLFFPSDHLLTTFGPPSEYLHSSFTAPVLLFITFGTSYVFQLANATPSRVVANCHKLPSAHFLRRRLDIEEIVSAWSSLLSSLFVLLPNANIVFTVSPIRHLADTLHGNQISKSTLLLAIDSLLSLSDFQGHLHYFPAYEILLDELRDYRFYSSDLLHPSDLAVQIIFQRLLDATTSSSAKDYIHKHIKQYKQSQHIPLH